MIQGGDFTNGDGTGGESCWGKPFKNECVDELSNIRGSVAYANSGADTNGSQFYINSVDNSASLDNGYTVFGQVFAGMDVVDLISDCEKTYGSDGNESSPVNTVELKSVDIEKYNIEGEFKIQFCKDLLNKITLLCLNELENIAHIEYGIDLKNSKFEMYGNKAIINDNGRHYEVSLVEGKLYTNYYSILIGEDEKIDTYLDWVGEVIELERSKK